MCLWQVIYAYIAFLYNVNVILSLRVGYWLRVNHIFHVFSFGYLPLDKRKVHPLQYTLDRSLVCCKLISDRFYL